MADLDVRITCPSCGHSRETMPVDRCVLFYDCPACQFMMAPKAGDCCIYCSYGDRRCPFAQEAVPCPGGSVQLHPTPDRRQAHD